MKIRVRVGTAVASLPSLSASTERFGCLLESQGPYCILIRADLALGFLLTLFCCAKHRQMCCAEQAPSLSYTASPMSHWVVRSSCMKLEAPKARLGCPYLGSSSADSEPSPPPPVQTGYTSGHPRVTHAGSLFRKWSCSCLLLASQGRVSAMKAGKLAGSYSQGPYLPCPSMLSFYDSLQIPGKEDKAAETAGWAPPCLPAGSSSHIIFTAVSCCLGYQPQIRDKDAKLPLSVRMGLKVICLGRNRSAD